MGRPTAWYEPLRGHRQVLLTTYRRDGTPVATPVWFVIHGGRVFFSTQATSGKVKRLRRDPRVLVAPCTLFGRALGPALPAQARLLEGQEAEAARRAVNRNRLRWLVFENLWNRLPGRSSLFFELLSRDVPPTGTPRRIS